MTNRPGPSRHSPASLGPTTQPVLSEGIRASFRRQSFERRHSRGDILLRQGDDGTHVLALLSGLAKVEYRTRNGSVRLLAFRGPNELLGELAVLGGGDRMASVVALSTCHVAVMDKTAFTRFIQGNDLTPALIRSARDRLRESAPDDAGLDQRLTTVLVQVADILVESGCRPRGPIELPLKRTELADYLGVSRDTVTDRLKGMEHAGISCGRTRIAIADLLALRLAVQRLPT
ncbi:Crp/Fnr family transcriptional regulator [Kitasatospora sp. NPDC058444]|uniref:Crp/Fnr family transcriptional regulator n=1 Tax=Kitasatospora sp. NPDC058444 TaxID=3346504 RepID=UPI00365F4332